MQAFWLVGSGSKAAATSAIALVMVDVVKIYDDTQADMFWAEVIALASAFSPPLLGGIWWAELGTHAFGIVLQCEGTSRVHFIISVFYLISLYF